MATLPRPITKTLIVTVKEGLRPWAFRHPNGRIDVEAMASAYLETHPMMNRALLVVAVKETLAEDVYHSDVAA